MLGSDTSPVGTGSHANAARPSERDRRLLRDKMQKRQFKTSLGDLPEHSRACTATARSSFGTYGGNPPHGPVLLLGQKGLAFGGRVDGAGELTLEAAERLATALALALLALQISAGRSVDAALGDRDPVQGAVELAVAAAVEPV